MLAPAHPMSATRQNLWRLTIIRILVLAAQAGSVGVAYWTELLPLPWFSLAATLALSSLLCAFTALRLRLTLPVTELEYALQLACDLLIHSALLYYSGGSTNPFVSYYLVPLAIASLLLSGIALVAYSLLLVQFYPLETLPLARDTMQVYGMWLSIALAAAVITLSCVDRSNCVPSAAKTACATSSCWLWPPRRPALPMSWVRRWRP